MDVFDCHLVATRVHSKNGSRALRLSGSPGKSDRWGERVASLAGRGYPIFAYGDEDAYRRRVSHGVWEG